MKYKIATCLGVKEVEGELITLCGVACAIRQILEGDKWGSYDDFSISELSTGMQVCCSMSREDAILQAQRLFGMHDLKAFVKRAKSTMKTHNMEFPLNIVSELTPVAK